MAKPPPRVTVQHRVEYAALRTMFAALRLVGWHAASSIGARVGQLGFWPFGIRRALVERHIATCFPEFTPAEVRQTAIESYQHLGRIAVETALLSGEGPDSVFGRFEPCDCWDVVEDAVAEGTGLIIVSGHFGNWELAGAYLGARMMANGSGFDVIVRRQGNPLFDSYLYRTRQRIGMTVVHDADAVRRTPRSLRAGRGMGFMIDQGVIGLASTFVPFFGRLAKTPRGMAVFALRFGTPVVFVSAIRQPTGKFRLAFERVPVHPTGDREFDVDTIVGNCTAVLERHVRRTPGQYFWQHRRWKHDPPPGTVWPPVHDRGGAPSTGGTLP